MVLNNKNRLFEVMGILNESFKPMSRLINESFINELHLVNEMEISDEFDVDPNVFNDIFNEALLSFGNGNSKLGKDVTVFELPAGWTCPKAEKCLEKVNRITGKSVAGPKQEYVCYAASSEKRYKGVREKRWRNYDLLMEAKGVTEMSRLLIKSLSYHFKTEGKTDSVRIHESGDFFNDNYLKAWINLAKQFPETHFYGHTKSLGLINKNKEVIDSLSNFKIILSDGGSDDSFRTNQLNMYIEGKVFTSPEALLKAGLLLDIDDSLARNGDNNFGMLIHGTQNKGTLAKAKLRNETFIHYWGEWKDLNRYLGFDDGKHIHPNVLKKLRTKYINYRNKYAVKNDNGSWKAIDSKNSKSINKVNSILRLLNYSVKYHLVYKFPSELEAIVPDKFK